MAKFFEAPSKQLLRTKHDTTAPALRARNRIPKSYQASTCTTYIHELSDAIGLLFGGTVATRP